MPKCIFNSWLLQIKYWHTSHRLRCRICLVCCVKGFCNKIFCKVYMYLVFSTKFLVGVEEMWQALVGFNLYQPWSDNQLQKSMLLFLLLEITIQWMLHCLNLIFFSFLYIILSYKNILKVEYLSFKTFSFHISTLSIDNLLLI